MASVGDGTMTVCLKIDPAPSAIKCLHLKVVLINSVLLSAKESGNILAGRQLQKHSTKRYLAIGKGISLAYYAGHSAGSI